MNLGVFNKVNSNQKEDGTSQREKMYSDWSSFSQAVQNHEVCVQSVLTALPLSLDAAKTIVSLIVQPIAATVGLNNNLADSGKLQNNKEVDWCMEVICHGLSLPLTEHDTIRHCVHIYCEWLTALLPNPKAGIPRPVLQQANFYARKMVSHLHNLFIPRADEAPDVINRQAVLCHRVLRTIQTIVQQSGALERDTWESLLLFLLSINDALLSPPTISDDIGDQLCDRVLGVLLEVWLQACGRCFPSPRLWKTLSELAQTWRHRTGLVTQWNRINVALTASLIHNMYGSNLPQIELSEEDKTLVPSTLSSECLAQTWYRILHFIGSPVTLARPTVISQTPKFLQFAINSLQVVDPSHHPCLAALPAIFVKAMKGISSLVDAFLGVSKTPTNSTSQGKGSGSNLKNFAQNSTFISGNYSPPAAARPRCNSILHMFGAWLFEAALLGCESPAPLKPDSKFGGSSLLADRSRASSVSTGSDFSGTTASRPRSSTVVETLDQRNVIPAEAYESGRAEAVGALCRIFSSKKSDEDILPVYLARFYLVLHYALKTKEDRVVSEAMASVIMHSTDLFRVDLDGVFTILLPIVDAVDLILSSKDLKIRSYVHKTDLRRASIHLLLSILAVPLNFQQLPIKDLLGSYERNVCTFGQLRPRLVQLVLTALQVETDPMNTHLLLGGLALVIQDLFAYEQTDRLELSESFAHLQSDSASNILSSASDTHSCHSVSSTSFPSLNEHTLENPDVNDTSLSGAPFSGPLQSVSLWSPNGLFTHTSHVICSKLLSSWKSDLNVSLAALEILSLLARLRIVDQDNSESRRVIKWLCDYISVQCSKPPPAHSKDLHSTIVAAFHCCAVWLMTHPYLASDYDCLNYVLQVTELGISGSKSLKSGESVKMKEDKELKPVSLRVRDAAELLLTSLVEQVGHFPSLCGARSVSCLIDEVTLLQQLTSPRDETPSLDELKKFRHFVAIDGSTLLSILDEPLEDEETQPTATVLLRNPFGRQAWTMQLRHLARHKCGIRTQNSNPGRPLPMNDGGQKAEFVPRYFPESVERVHLCLADKAVPSMDSSLSTDDRLAADVDKLGRLIDTSLGVSLDYQTLNNPECVAPVPSHEFQTARLLLSHLGFLSVDNDDNGRNLVSLDSRSQNFWQELKNLDQIPNRTYDTLHVFYVRAGQKTASEILSNVTHPSTVHPHFMEFLQSLGWCVRIGDHPGWTGHSSTSWKLKNAKNSNFDIQHPIGSSLEGSAYNGQNKVLYWADAFSEMAFIVPTLPADAEMHGKGSTAKTEGPAAAENAAEPEVPLRKRTVKHGPHNTNPDFKMIAVWIESFEDSLNFPLDELMDVMSTGPESTGGLSSRQERTNDCFIIFIHALQSGLYRIHLRGPQSRINLATPLVDGMVVSRRTLGPMIRYTVLNMAKRRRLDHDSYQPPHVRRKLKIQELAQRYRADLETPDFFTRLFTSV